MNDWFSLDVHVDVHCRCPINTCGWHGYVLIGDSDISLIFTFSKQSFNESLEFCNRSWPCAFHKIWLTAAKLTCRCNTLQTSNLFARSQTGVVIDSKPDLSPTCKTSLLFAPLAVLLQAGCLAFPFYSPTKPLIRLYIKYKTVLIPTLKYLLYFGYL